jgi:uncharacterized protein (TIGR02145 family)
MKKTLKLLLTGFILAGSPALLKAQVPEKFNYQGIARDTKGNPMGKQTLGIKLSVLPTSDATTPEYEEVQTITTNEFGLYTLQIGNGTAITGTMKAVKWETGNKYIKVAIDPQGGTNYMDAGTTQLLSVPYAIYADKAGMAKDAGGSRAGNQHYLSKFDASGSSSAEINSQIFDNGTSIGIATTTPAAKVHIDHNASVVQEHLRMQNRSTTGAGRFTMYNNGTNSYATFTKYGSAYTGGYAGVTTQYPYANLLAFGNNGVNPNDGLGRFLISTAGNAGISLFKGGTSKLKFHADFTTENVGIGGNAAPVSRVHMNNTDGTTMDVRLTNNTTGHTSSDGLELRTTGNTARLINQENAGLLLGTNNTDRLSITGSGNVGIGITSPHASALTELSSTTQGFLPPRMTDAQRVLIASPADGLIIFNTTTGCPNYYFGGNWHQWCGEMIGTITALNCGSATTNGTLYAGTAATGVSSTVPYTGGNGGAHNGQSVASTGVTGLTATLSAGTFANGIGSLTYTISGTPNGPGTANFALSIGGQSCTFTRTVNAAPVYPAGSIFCNGIPTAVVDVTNPVTGKIWMDRNLGASQAATGSTDTAAYGDLYQWGRGADGHQCRNSATTFTLSSTDQPGHGDFILANSGINDWRSPQNNNLWQGVNGVNNPCPSAYRLPTDAELEAERTSWMSNNDAGAFASPLKFPVAGFRDASAGSLASVGSNGFYWSSTVNGTFANFLYFFSSIAYMNLNFRARGLSVRCLKD